MGEKIEKISPIFIETISMTFNYFTDPSKRIFYVYILSSFILATFVYFSKKRKASFFQYFFHKKTWLGKSAQIDYLFLFFNSLIKLILIAPLLIFSLKIAFHLNQYLVDSFGYFELKLSKGLLITLYTLCLFFIGDFASFFLHYLQHKIPFLWRFHKIHHSATVLNPITQYRIHPFELILLNVKTIVIMGLLMGVFEYFANQRISVYTYLGVNVLNFIFLFFGANLRHSSVAFKYPTFLEYIFISPFQHQIHHSENVKHFDKNLGSKLAIWDWLFGTLIVSKKVNKVHYGLGEENKNYKTFFANLLNPFYTK